MNRTEVKDSIKNKVESVYNNLVAIRHHIHAHPELSFQEYNTTKFIAAQLDSLGIPYETKFADTGLVAYINGKKGSSKTTALRADIDALPILEANEVSYCSENEGVMHACGHDVHSTCLLGAAMVLNELKDVLNGTVQLIFQPGEEKLPGGASIMVKNGVLEGTDNIIGQHVHPPLDTGKVGFKPGFFMASADEIHITVKGSGGHAALPDNYNNPIPVAAQLITNLYKAVNDATPADIPTVFALGKVEAKGATNIIPSEVNIAGTFRTVDETWRQEVHRLIEETVENVKAGFAGKIELDIPNGYPSLINDEELTLRSKQNAVEYLGEENVVDLPLRMTSEDFSFYTHVVPGCFYRLGTRNEAKGIVSPVHTPTFDIDHEALKVGAGLMAWLAFCELIPKGHIK